MATDTSTVFKANSDRQLIDPSNLSEEIILNKINNIRSNLQLKETPPENVKDSIIPIKESFCHAFYRMLGLPVINKDATKFYNPGFTGNEQNVNTEEINAINNDQNQLLLTYERMRENICYQNTISFEKPDPKFQYRLDMLKQRMPVDVIDENLDAFFETEADVQTKTLDKRILYKSVTKILRPFKCQANIINNVYPITNSVCAPFISENNSYVNSTKLIKPYIEFVCRVRFSKDISSNSKDNKLYTELSKQVQKFNLPQEVQQGINSFAFIEDYIILQMFQSLYYISKKVGEDAKASEKIVDQINEKIKISNSSEADQTISFDTIDSVIEQLQAQIASKELILSVLPNYTIQDSTGTNIKLQNSIDCPLISPFIKLVQPNINELKKQVDYLNTEKQKRISKFNSLNKNIFYVIGEVNGLGLLDVITIMLAFWSIPREYLLSMLDNSSFIRLYREPNLRNETVEQRHKNNDSPTIPIKKVIQTFDKTIVYLLKTCEEMIKTNSA